MYDSIDAIVVSSYFDGESSVNILPIITFHIQKNSKSSITISNIMFENKQGDMIKSFTDPKYLVTSMSNYIDLDGVKKNIDNHIYSTTFPYKLEGKSSAVLTFQLRVPHDFDLENVYLNTSRKKVNLNFIKELYDEKLNEKQDDVNNRLERMYDH